MALEKIITTDSLNSGKDKINKIVDKIELEGMTTSNIAKSAVTYEKTNFLNATKTANIFNENTIIQGQVLYVTTGSMFPNADWIVSDKIPVERNTQYTSNNSTMRYCEYDASNNFIKGANDISTFTTSATTVFIRVTLRKTVTNFMLVKGSVAQPYEPYYKNISILGIPFNKPSEPISSLSGKTVITFGDSITWYDGQTYLPTHKESGQKCVGYVSYLSSKLGMIVNNQGESGYTAANVNAKVQATDLTLANYITLTAGANDWSTNVPIGTVNAPLGTYDTSTYAGALQSAIEYIKTKNATAKIILITPIRGYHPNHNPIEGVSVEAVEEQPKKFAEVLKQLAEMYGLELVDFRDKLGLNFTNYTKYLLDDPEQTSGKYVHPGNEFHKIMGEYLVSRIKNMAI